MGLAADEAALAGGRIACRSATSETAGSGVAARSASST
ncbi:hypothetical protein SCE1572_40725 [Sorangium cellulosum So0157-2]|uniref:Uncharacterized protein n=1 Tax=Sorangium cellulosum So0157-2 TaxID=1254432 RepID=S4Y629_SORCE|nr:hypothetical protein SCE1572_40725 [Sorangium cellulosum So0157-2]